MADISTELQAIQNAKYGREVRGSIYQALAAMASELTDFEDTAIVGKNTLNMADNLNTIYRSGMYWYSNYSDGAPQNWAFESNVQGRLIVFGGGTNYPSTKAQMVISIDGRLAYRFGTSVSEWGDWNTVAVDMDERAVVKTFGTTLSATSIRDLGFSSYLDLPVNKIYRLDNTVPDSFGLPHSAAYAGLFVYSPKVAATASMTYYLLSQGGEYYYASSAQSDVGWQKIIRTTDEEQIIKIYEPLLNSSKLASLGWSTKEDMTPNQTYRFGTGVSSSTFDLPDTNTGGLTMWKLKPAGDMTSSTVHYLAAQNKRLYWNSATSGDGWEVIMKSLQPRNYVAIGASTLTGAITGQSNHSKYVYPFYVGKYGNFKVTNLAVGGTDFIARVGSGYNNYMDVITDPANQSTFESADLITINIGGNDYNEYDSTGDHIGAWDDYYAFERGTSSSTLHSDATKAGAANFCLYYIARHFPHAQIMMVLAPVPPGGTSFATPSGNKMVYTPAANAIASHDNKVYFDLVYEVFQPLCEHARIPLIDARHQMFTAYHNGADKYSGVHPLEDEYPQYSIPVAAMILAQYRG